MTVSDLMQAMSDAGAPMGAIIIAVRALEEKDAILASKRAVERDRKRKQRGTVTGQSRDEDGTVPEAPPLPKTPQTPQTPTPPCKDITPRPRKAGFDLPERIPAEPWAGFEEMRRKIGKPMTDRARVLAVNELDRLAADGWPAGDVLNHCTMNSYQGIFPPKDQRHGQSRKPEHEWGSTVSAAESVIAELERKRAAGRGSQAFGTGA